MGTWGTSLYSNDSTCDVRGDYVDKLMRGKTNEEATQELIYEHRDILGDNEDEPLFWFALADTQWNYGRLLPEIKEKAQHFLSQDKELERWAESGQKHLNAWKATLDKLKNKLESDQPPAKKISLYKFYQCKWHLGDVFAYQFSGSYSDERGFLDKYVVFRKTSEDTWWPGHIIPVVQVFDWIGDSIPDLDTLSDFDLLPLSYRVPNSNNPPSYEIKLLSDSARSIPTKNLHFIGNLPGTDLTPFRGHDYWTGYHPVGWENSKYNYKFEHFIINMYLSWHA